ncbi:hypothetical protein TA3x_001383 [Tundrisphaera sp. TA3]|uniref:hypothetical protein n=1 Tax=Tundrisphaera sp. TA3 TaxID=3435775 RepID=UPI003EB8E36B
MSPSSTLRTAWIVLILASAPIARADYTLIDLGAIAPIGSTRVQAMNASGVAVGTMRTNGVDQVYRLDGGSGGSSLPGTATSSGALGVNEHGDFAGSFVDPRNGNVAHAFRVVDGMFQDLGTLPGGSAVGTAINGAGDVAGYGYLPGGIQRAFRSMGGGSLTAIDPLAGGISSSASGINLAGTVVGTSQLGNGVNRAFIAELGGPAQDLLGLHPGSSFTGSTYATGINDQGVVIGYGDFGVNSHAFLAPVSGPLIDLGVAGSARSSLAYGLNGKNQVVGVLGYGGGLTHAFYWDELSRMVDLNTVLSARDRESWVLTHAFAIGDTGRITGLGYKDGELHAFALQPNIVPEPPAWALTAIGGTIAAGWARLRRGRRPGRAGA